VYLHLLHNLVDKPQQITERTNYQKQSSNNNIKNKT